MKISYLVTLYNKAKTIEIVIRQIIKEIELFPVFYKGEIVIVNDGSTDQSLLIVQSLQNKYKDLIKIFCQENQGVVAATSKAISCATGDWVRFVDADDLVILGSTISLIEMGEKYNSVAVLSSSGGFFFEEKIKEEYLKNVQISKKKDPFIVANPVRSSLRYTLAVTSGILVKSDILPLINMDIKIRYAQDHYIIALASYLGPILQSGLTSFLYCAPGENSLSKNFIKMSESSLDLAIAILQEKKSPKEDWEFVANFSSRRLARVIRKKFRGKIFSSRSLLYNFLLMTILGRINFISYRYKIDKIKQGYELINNLDSKDQYLPKYL